jgi:hypothetical protein
MQVVVQVEHVIMSLAEMLCLVQVELFNPSKFNCHAIEVLTSSCNLLVAALYAKVAEIQGFKPRSVNNICQ